MFRVRSHQVSLRDNQAVYQVVNQVHHHPRSRPVHPVVNHPDSLRSVHQVSLLVYQQMDPRVNQAVYHQHNHQVHPVHSLRGNRVVSQQLIQLVNQQRLQLHNQLAFLQRSQVDSLRDTLPLAQVDSLL